MSIRVGLRHMARSAVAVPVVPPVCIGYQDDGADFRVDDPAASLVDMWIERVGNGLGALIWAEIPSIGAGETKTVYLYYGNEVVATVSDGDATFMLFDDFEGDLSRWPDTAGTPTIVEEDATGNHVCLLNDTDSISAHEDDEDWTDYGIRFRYQHKVDGANGPRAIFFMRLRWDPATQFCALKNEIGRIAHNYWYLDENFGGTIHERDTDGAVHTIDLWETLEIRTIGAVFTALRNGAAWMTGALTTVDYGGILTKSVAAVNAFWYDDVKVFKLASPEPSISVGDVEAGSWTLNGDVFTCRRPVEIDNSGGGALTDYQVQIEVPITIPDFDYTPDSVADEIQTVVP